jgi:hypothetical protein
MVQTTLPTTSLQDRLRDLKPKVLDQFCRRALDGAIHALDNTANPLRLNFFSTALRMLYEHTMKKLAPADQVKLSPWFTVQQEGGNPTRGQRIQFAVQGGLMDAFLTDELQIDIGPMRKRLVKAVDNLGKHVHGDEAAIIADPVLQDQEADSVIAALAAFLDTYAECRSAILEPIQERLDDAAVNVLLAETIQAVDELATHHSIEEVYVASTVVQSIGVSDITYRATGTLSVVLQWGSNSDLRRGDGAELDQSFPFSCDIVVPLEDPWDLDVAEASYGIDARAWHRAMAPDELQPE